MNPTSLKRLVLGIPKFTFWMTIALIVFLLIFYWFVSDRTAFGEWITIWPSFFWVFGLIPLAMLSYDRKRPQKCLILLGAILFFVLTTIETRSLIRFPDSIAANEFEALRSSKPIPGQPVALRIASWNINSGSGGRKIVLEKLASLKPDLCFLQETPDGSESLQPEGLSGYWSGFTWNDEGDCGLLSRYPIKTVPSRRIGPWSNPQLVIIEPTTGTAILLMNVRLMLPSLVINPLSGGNLRQLVSDHSARMDQFRNLSMFMSESINGHRVTSAILCGDFNTPANMASIEPLRKIMHDAWREHGHGWGATMTNQFPVARIDQCWVTPNIRIIDCWVVEGNPSDHRMLMTDLIIDPLSR